MKKEEIEKNKIVRIVKSKFKKGGVGKKDRIVRKMWIGNKNGNKSELKRGKKGIG